MDKMSYMAKLYYKKISDRETNLATGCEWLIDDVPVRWRNEVQAMLDGAL